MSEDDRDDHEQPATTSETLDMLLARVAYAPERVPPVRNPRARDGVSLRGWCAARRRTVDAVVDLCAKVGAQPGGAHAALTPDRVWIRLDGSVELDEPASALARGSATAHHADTPAGTEQPAFAACVREALGEREVPRWLQAVLRRAAASRPQDRYPSVTALLATIARGRPRHPRRTIAVVAAGASLAAGAAMLLVWRGGGGGGGGGSGDGGAAATLDDRCARAGAAIDVAWNADRADAMAAAFPDNTEGAAAASLLRGRLDRYAAAWSRGRIETCRAADGIDPRMDCLDRARDRLGGLVAWLPGASRSALAHADLAVDELPDLGRCADPARWTVTVAPKEATAQEQIASARARLDAIAPRLHDPTTPVLPAETQAVLDRAAAAGWAPLTASASWFHAEALRIAGRALEAIAAYREAVRWSLLAGDDELGARAMADLAVALAHDDADQEARSSLAMARAVAERLGSPPALAIQLCHDAAAVAVQGRRLDEAIGEALAAVALAGSVDGVGTTTHTRTLAELAVALIDAGRVQDALALLDQAVAGDAAQLGSGHPAVAADLITLAVGAMELTRFADARIALDRALLIRERWYGPGHVEVAEPLQALGALHLRLGELDAARLATERALALLTPADRSASADHAMLESNLAMLEAASGRFDAAIERGARALAELEVVKGPSDPMLVEALILLGFAERGRGNLDASAMHLRRAVTIAELAHGAGHPATQNPRVELAHTELARGRAADGMALLERIVADGSSDHEVAASTLAEASLALAGALWQHGGDRRRAVRLATDARDGYASLGDGFDPQRAEAQRWLDDHDL